MNIAYSQKGAVLITSLIVLLLLTIIGVSSMRSSIMEEKMAQNARDQLTAFEAAEAAMRDADDRIDALRDLPSTCDTLSSDCAVYWKNALDDLSSYDQSWWTSDSHSHEISDSISDARTDPRYIVELLNFERDSLREGHEVGGGQMFFRVTASGTGTSDAAQTIVQSTVVRRIE